MSQQLDSTPSCGHPNHGSDTHTCMGTPSRTGCIVSPENFADVITPSQVAENVRWNAANRIAEAISSGHLDGSNPVAVADAIRSSGSREEFAAALDRHKNTLGDDACPSSPSGEHDWHEWEESGRSDTCTYCSGSYNPFLDEGAKTAENVPLLLAEIDDAVQDYRRVFPEPHKLAPNLNLAVRAAKVLTSRVTPATAAENTLDEATKVIKDFLALYTLPANYSRPYGPNDSHGQVAQRGAEGIVDKLVEHGLISGQFPSFEAITKEK